MEIGCRNWESSGSWGCSTSLPSNYSHIMNVALDVPADVSDAFGVRGHVPVVGTADGAELTATLVPVGGGRHRLFLNGAVRGAIGKGAGDSVEIRIRLDRSDRTPRHRRTCGRLWLERTLWQRGRRLHLRGARNSSFGWPTLSGTRLVPLASAASCRPLSRRAHPVWNKPPAQVRSGRASIIWLSSS